MWRRLLGVVVRGPLCLLCSEETVKLKEAREAVALVITEAKTWVWEHFEEAMEKDFWLHSRKFWQTVR